MNECHIENSRHSEAEDLRGPEFTAMEALGVAISVLAGVATLVALFLGRLLWVLRMKVGRPLPRRAQGKGLKTLVVLGSGGHTAEMLNLLAALDLRKHYTPRHYVAGATDKMSLRRAQTFEEEQVKGAPSDASYHSIYRSREVGQSYATSVVTTLAALAHAVWIVARIQPQLILCNGPGTCLPVCIMGFVLRVLGVRDVVLVYVESVARVEKLSLTGAILHRLGIADQFIVQWPELVQKYKGTLYLGRLM